MCWSGRSRDLRLVAPKNRDTIFARDASAGTRCIVAVSEPIISHINKSAAISEQIYIATTLGEIEELREFWQNKNRHPDVDVDFFSLLVATSNQVSNPYVIVGTHDGQPKAMIVGRLENERIAFNVGYRALFRTCIRQIMFLQGGYLGYEFDGSHRAMVREVLNQLKKGTAERVVFSNLDQNTALHRIVKVEVKAPFRKVSARTVERWRTTLGSTFEQFLERRSRKHRYWLRRIGRVFEEAHPGKVKYRTCEQTSDVEWFCSNAEKIAQKTYQRGLRVGFVNSADTQRRLKLAAEKGWLKAHILFVAEDPLAFWCGRLYKNIMYLDWTGYDPAYQKYEIGTVLFLKMVEDLCKSGVTEIDYGVGAAFYKKRFGDHYRLEESVFVYPPTVKGFVVSTLTILEVFINSFARFMTSKLGVTDRLRRSWRQHLATQAGTAN